MSWQQAYTAYLFDLDGTLVDSAPDINAALNHSLAYKGLATVDLALTRDFVGRGSRALIQLALEHQNISAKQASETIIEEMLREFLAYYEANIAVHSKPFPGVEKTLTTLRARGAKLAVVTNKYDHLTRKVLTELGLIRYFDVLVSSETTPTPKPAAAPALYACEKLNVAPDEVLFVGDASPDVGCARAAGCAVIVFKDGYNNGVGADQLGADGVYASITELLSAS